ncbi:hypothetical protein IP69_08235 [Bosea sp. AAP35]|uniref:Bug family tripartite tricarboxylate transporter substrate binding protein n=1 Tax=Bosea sp. AAP35 TaxID=1523417 RepID=UPI0006CC37F9|nr:tripartite tricarboxylate transporter substrate binding protein [Bosea sp. AAP35]KPF70911.1 hypothetical protein IP69_08235 [Bosea sp. AAP35]
MLKPIAILSQIAALSAALGPAFPAMAASKQYPVKPVIIVVPAPRGGGTDIFARELAKIVEEDLKQAVIIDNKPRGGGTDGVSKAVSADPDGYTLAFVWNSPLTAKPLAAHVSYTPQSYQAVMSIGFSSYVLCAQPGFPGETAQDFINELKAKPNGYTVGNDGVGGTMHLASERIFQQIGAKVQAIPYVGSTDTARNFLAGQVDIYGGSLSTILPHVRDKKAKCLLLTSAADNAALPQAGGLDSVGLGNIETVLWWGLIAPAGTPRPIVDNLEAAFIKAASTERFKLLMAKQGATLKIRNSSQTTALIKTEAEALKVVADGVGLRKN